MQTHVFALPSHCADVTYFAEYGVCSMTLVVSGAGANCLNMYSQWLELASSSLVQCE